MDLATYHKCLSDPTRLRIANLLLKGPLCVCQIQDLLQEPQVKTSKHLGYMKSRGLVSVRREANWNFYGIAPQLPPIIQSHLQALEAHASEDAALSADLERLEQSQAAVSC